MSTPALIIATNTAGDSEAGPTVATILVRFITRQYAPDRVRVGQYDPGRTSDPGAGWNGQDTAMRMVRAALSDWVMTRSGRDSKK